MPKDGQKDSDGLTAKQKLFCDNYLSNGFKSMRAALDAGYSQKSAQVIAAQNMTKPCIYNYINARMSEG